MVNILSIYIINYESCLLTKDLIKDLVKPGHKRHIAAVQSNILIIHPHLLRKQVN